MRAFGLLFIFGVVISGASNSPLADQLKASSDFNQLPTPIKSYVLSLGVEQGLKNPADVSFGEITEFKIPVLGSDLNLDGKVDYYAAACMFAPAESESIYQTNGFPCAYAVLILSSSWGGYESIDTRGTLMDAKAGTPSTVTIAQRNFNDCGDSNYMCLAQYTVQEDSGSYVLKLQHIAPAP